MKRPYIQPETIVAAVSAAPMLAASQYTVPVDLNEEGDQSMDECDGHSVRHDNMWDNKWNNKWDNN